MLHFQPLSILADVGLGEVIEIQTNKPWLLGMRPSRHLYLHI